jgi:hypothetical protein
MHPRTFCTIQFLIIKAIRDENVINIQITPHLYFSITPHLYFESAIYPSSRTHLPSFCYISMCIFAAITMQCYSEPPFLCAYSSLVFTLIIQQVCL